MSYKIEVDQKESFPKAVFEVSVSSQDGETVHNIVLNEDYYSRLSDKEVLPEELVEASFKFLLDRESNIAILSEFDLRDINKYFPEYEWEVRSYFEV